MNITLAAGPLVSLIAGVLILIVPRLLNYIVALYLIVIGLLGLFGGSNYRVGGNAMAAPEGAGFRHPSRAPSTRCRMAACGRSPHPTNSRRRCRSG